MLNFISHMRSFKLAILGLTLVYSTSALSAGSGFSYSSDYVRGVSLGGWLVPEPWITPSLFTEPNNPKIVDEYTFCKLQDVEVARAALTKHWDTWVTEKDFAAIAAAGLNHVRIPIGYWAFEVGPGEPFVQGQLPYLSKAVTWAKAHGLRIIIDLHGVPGSQNGFDNSGQRMETPKWHTNTTSIARTKAIIKTMADMFKDQENVVPIIQPLNEPAGFYGPEIVLATKEFYQDAYELVRHRYKDNKKSDTILLFHDAFVGLDSWNNFMPEPKYEGVMFDTHIYQMFSAADVGLSQEGHLSKACSTASSLSKASHKIIVGEWTPAPTDCTRFLNGIGRGARFDGTYLETFKLGDCSVLTGKKENFSEEYKVFLRKMWEAQVISFEKGSRGWIMWTWKAENSDDWSYQAGLEGGWIPQNPTDYKYPRICA